MLLAHCDAVQDNFSDDLPLTNDCLPTFCLPLQELDVLVGNTLNVPAIYDTGSQIVVIRKDIIQSLGIYINTQQLIEMEGANGATNWTVGCAENLSLQVGDVPFKIHAHVIKNVSFGILFGRPFQQALLCRFEDLPGGKVELSVRDPSNISCQVYIPTCPRIGRTPAIKIISVINHALPPTLPPPAQVTVQHPPLPFPLADALMPPLDTNSTTSAQHTHPYHDRLHTRFRTTEHISKAQQGEYSCWPAFMHFTHLTDFAATCGSPNNPFPFPHFNLRCTDLMLHKFLVHPVDPSPAHTRLTCSTTHLLISPPEHSNLSCQQIILASGTDINESTQEGRFLNPPEGVERAHTVALESAISDHMTAPELPKPNNATQAMQSQHVEFLTHFTSSSSPRSFCFPHLPPSLSANQTQATYSQDLPLATHQAPSAEETWIAQIGPANNKPKDDTAPCCMRSALPLPTVPRSGPIRKDSE